MHYTDAPMIAPPVVLTIVAIGDDVRITIQKVPIVSKNNIRNKMADSSIYGNMRLIMCEMMGSMMDCKRACASGVLSNKSILSPICDAKSEVASAYLSRSSEDITLISQTLFIRPK